MTTRWGLHLILRGCISIIIGIIRTKAVRSILYPLTNGQIRNGHRKAWLRVRPKRLEGNTRPVTPLSAIMCTNLNRLGQIAWVTHHIEVIQLSCCNLLATNRIEQSKWWSPECMTTRWGFHLILRGCISIIIGVTRTKAARPILYPLTNG